MSSSCPFSSPHCRLPSIHEGEGKARKRKRTDVSGRSLLEDIFGRSAKKVISDGLLAAFFVLKRRRRITGTRFAYANPRPNRRRRKTRRGRRRKELETDTRQVPGSFYSPLKH